MIKLQKSTFLNEKETKVKLCDFISNASILSMGVECKKFEESFAIKQNCSYAAFVNSGSSANLILIQAFLNSGRLKKNDIIGISALTWSTNIMPLIQLGLHPFLVDCETDSLNVSSETLLQAFDVQPNIKALFITNTLGLSDDIGAIASICLERNVLLFEDNCESLGSVVSGKLLGNYGIASTFSFFVGHHLSTIEGGMICTNDTELYNHLIMARAHGWDRNLNTESQNEIRARNGINEFYAKYTFYDLGYNCRPTEINGFLGNNQINYWDTIVSKRHQNFMRLHRSIKSNDNLLPLRFEHMDVVSSFAMPVIIRDISLVDFYKKIFIEAEVEIRPMIAGNMARQPFFRKYVSNPGSQPNAEFIHKHSFYFGNNPELTIEEIELLSALLEK